MPVVSVIVLNHNGAGYVKECIEAILAQSFADYELIVVDNGSSDGSLEIIRGILPAGAKLIENGRNLGYAEGNNRGIEGAKGEWVALLNNDAAPDRLWLRKLMDAVGEEGGEAGVGMAASKILCYEERDILDNTGHLIYPDGLNRGRGRLERDNGQYEAEREVLFPSGCAGLYRREMLEQVDGFDADFFAYGDDADLGLRGRLMGWRCIFVPEARVYHRYSAGAGAYSEFKAYHVERNRVWVMVKLFPAGWIARSPLYTLLRYGLQAYGALSGRGAAGKFAGTGGKFRLARILLKALLDAARGLRVNMAKRRRIMAKAALSGKDMAELLRAYRISAAEIALKE